MPDPGSTSAQDPDDSALLAERRLALLLEAGGEHRGLGAAFHPELGEQVRHVAYLRTVDPMEAERARARYACFDHVGGEGQACGDTLAFEGAIPCEDEVVAQLIVLRRRAEAYLRRHGWSAEDELFFAEQNARIVRDADEYSQHMYRADLSSWNLRDRHMPGTLDASDHLARHVKADLQRRLARIEGQIRGIQSMLSDDRERRDVVTQIAAASKALEQVGFRLLASGLTWCLQDPDGADADGYPVAEVEKLFLELA
jgi:DNA-binding FrmR family transcriptional regulator